MRRLRLGLTAKEKREAAKIEKENKQRIIEESRDNFRKIILNASNINSKSDFFSIKKEGLADFFQEFFIETNKIHILRGSNGQGKSTLIKNIVNCNFLGQIDAIKERLKISSVNKKTAELLNFNLPFSAYKEESLFENNLKENLTTMDNSITLYTDFSINYFREESGNIFSDVNEEYFQRSHGERKIKGINSIFIMLKEILSILEKETKIGLNLFVVMDEPESGLSIDIQEEFAKKVKRYLNLAKKNPLISLTFILSSHSYVWNKDGNIKIHKINDFKELNDRKKEHKRVFI